MMTKKATHSTTKLSSTKSKAVSTKTKAVTSKVKAATSKTKAATSKAKTSMVSTKTATKSTTKSSKNNSSYITNGLTINPTSFSSGDKIKITYTGLLLQSGANEIYAHVGWGDSWDDVNDIKMSKTKSGFTATLTVKKSSVINMCFKDALDNWDNNNGYNYAIYPSKKK